MLYAISEQIPKKKSKTIDDLNTELEQIFQDKKRIEKENKIKIFSNKLIDGKW
jgi:hypothetical protein